MLQRRALLRAVLAGLLGWVGYRPARSDERRAATRAVYHLCEAERVEFALATIANHIGAVDEATYRLCVVVHGPALKMFRGQYPLVAVERSVHAAIDSGVAFYACTNTMAAEDITLDDLLPGFQATRDAAVAYLADLQAQGWAYLRP